MYATIQPRLIALLNDDHSDSLGSYPRFDLPPLQDPNILKASGRPSILEPAASRNDEQSVPGSQSTILSYDGDSPGSHNKSTAKSSIEPSAKSSVIDSSVGEPSAQSLRKILSDDSEITHPSATRKRQRLENRSGDFVQLPQPPRKQKAVKQRLPGNKNPGNKRVGVQARKKWTDEETRNLILGVQKHGIGNWKSIFEDKELTFNGRTPVHIKDRFRTCFPGALQNDNIIRPISKASRKPSDSSKPHMDPSSIATREEDSSNSSDDSTVNEKPNGPQAKSSKKPRPHRKYFDDLVEQGVVQAFPKSTRRGRRLFTEEEDKNIKKGVETYGQSSWTLIQRDPKFGLESRKPTDIRDRFRNLFRDKCNVDEEGENPRNSASATASFEIQPLNGSLSLPTQESLSQDRMFGPVQYYPDIGIPKQAMQPPSFNFRGSFTEFLGPLPVTDAADAFSFPPSFDWQDNTAPFSSTIGEMDISRLLLDDSWATDPNSNLKQKQSVTDISSVLGCTGSVGQRFILLLAQHPHFKLHAVGASSRSAGKKYKDAVKWKQASPMGADIAELVVKDCKSSEFADCDVVFSGLDAEFAGEIEMEFVKANIPIFSNAKNYRKDPMVPLVVPTVNLPHFDVIPAQRKKLGLGKGFLVCNSNCAVIGLVIPFAALQKAFGPVSQVSVVTMQAVSGAGYPGVSSMDMIDNVVPFISGEEDKLENEAQKILGGVNAEVSGFAEQKELKISAACNRVPVLDGHTACVSLKFERRPPPSAEQVKQAMRDYVSEAQELGCPSAPQNAILVMDEPDRPQPRLDRDTQKGYTVSVGRVREDESEIFDIKFVALSHNTVIGAAGSSILNAEAAVLKGYIE
ncbi:hypothetical protein ACLOAV_001546 [Pseudogymnoascus australis]